MGGAEPLATSEKKSRLLNFFGSWSYARLFAAQVLSSLGDWIGLLATIALAGRLGGDSAGGATALVLSARMIPGFFFAQVAGVLADRWDRKRLMVVCDIGRGLVMATFPFVSNVLQLFVASLALELLTLLWTPAKEASIPNIVPKEKIQNVNSLNLAAAYGTFPLASGVLALLVKLAEKMGQHDPWRFLNTDKNTIAISFDVMTFFLSAAIISTLIINGRNDRADREPIDFTKGVRELREGWEFVGYNPVIRSIIIGLGTGLFGGAMVVPLGTLYAQQVLGAGDAGYSLLLTALGCGVAAGVLIVAWLGKRVSSEWPFSAALLLASISLLGAAMSNSLNSAIIFAVGLGVAAGSVYVVGFSMLHHRVDDHLRGRVFASLYAIVRFSVVLSFAVAPLLSEIFDKTISKWLGGSDATIELGGFSMRIPGLRLTLAFGAGIIFLAWLLVRHAIHADPATPPARIEEPTNPSGMPTISEG